jgi:hypothetical protein
MGAPLDPMVYSSLISTEVDSSMFVPSQFRLVFREIPEKVLLPAGLQLGTTVTVTVTSGGAPTPLINAEVTSVETEYGPDGALTVVRGLDLSHRLMRGTATMAYPDMTASDVVLAVLGEAGVIPGEIVETSTVYEWLSQANVSPWVFIQQLANLENYVAYADTMGLFNFGPMPNPSEGLPPVMSYVQPPQGGQLVKGVNLVRLHSTVTGGEQVPAVTVTGYDPKMAAPVVGAAPGIPSTSLSLDPATLPAVVAGEFESPPFLDASRPVDSEGAAMTRARSIAADIAGSLVEMEGECQGNPAVLAGESISIGMAGMPFDGQYIVSSARHVFEPENDGYTTWFTVGGFRDRSTFALASGNSGVEANRPHISGVVNGTVVDNMDDQNLGRVKVMFPWLAASYVSAWARTVQIGASEAGSGFLWVPEIGDEVLVGFDRGDIDHPYVLGNLYNGVVQPIPAPAIDGVVANRRIASRMRHMIQFDDGPDALGITVQTGTQTCTIKLDDEEQAISIETMGQVTIQAGAEGLTINSLGDVDITATGALSMTGASISVEGNIDASVSAPDITVSGDASVSVSGALISLGG